MTPTPTPLSFTKLIVDDLDRLARFYTEVYGMQELDRVQAEIGSDAIDEIILGFDGEYAGGLILLKFVDEPAPTQREAILGFTTTDIAALFERVEKAGGGVYAAARRNPGDPYSVGFVTDPEGHLAEIVQMHDA